MRSSPSSRKPLSHSVARLRTDYRIDDSPEKEDEPGKTRSAWEFSDQATRRIGCQSFRILW